MILWFTACWTEESIANGVSFVPIRPSPETLEFPAHAINVAQNSSISRARFSAPRRRWSHPFATEVGQMIDSKVQKSSRPHGRDRRRSAFVIDPVTGFSTAIAICLHELPHELGDFALLIKSGVPLRRAVSLNVVSSVLSFIGMAVGLAVSTESTAKWIYAATAGSFLYIALVPELQKVERTFKAILCNILGVGLGGLVMLAIANYEDSISQLFEA